MKSSQIVNQIVSGIVAYLEEKKSLDLLPQISKELTKQSWVKIDPNLATVSTRFKLNQNQLKEIKTNLSNYFKRPIRIKSIQDSSIIAGLKITIAGQEIDATVNRQLKELKSKLLYD